MIVIILHVSRISSPYYFFKKTTTKKRTTATLTLVTTIRILSFIRCRRKNQSTFRLSLISFFYLKWDEETHRMVDRMSDYYPCQGHRIRFERLLEDRSRLERDPTNILRSSCHRLKPKRKDRRCSKGTFDTHQRTTEPMATSSESILRKIKFPRRFKKTKDTSIIREHSF